MLILPPELISISEPALKIAAFLDVEASFLIELLVTENTEGVRASEETAKPLSLAIEMLLFEAIEIFPPESRRLFLKLNPEIFGSELLEVIVRSPSDFILPTEATAEPDKLLK